MPTKNATTQMVQACEKSGYSNIIKLLPDTSEVKIRVRDSYTIQITPGMLLLPLSPTVELDDILLNQLFNSSE